MTLIGRPAAPVPLMQALAVPAISDPNERARYAWEAFSAAMAEVSAGYDGWRVQGGCRCSLGTGEAWVEAQGVHTLRSTELRCPDLIIERHHRIVF